MRPLPVINRGIDNDIPNKATPQHRIAGCGHCMALGAENNRVEGSFSRGLCSIHDKNIRSLSEMLPQWSGSDGMVGKRCRE